MIITYYLLTLLTSAALELHVDSIAAETFPADSLELDQMSFQKNIIDLVEIVAEEEVLLMEGSVEDLMSLVSNVYTSIESEGKITSGVLNFLENVYDEHGYSETGSWVKSRGEFRYQPYSGELPTYTKQDFRKPQGKITSRFGYRSKYGKIHNGTDYALNTGDTVFSALPGVVTGIGFDPAGYGNYVVLSHAGDVQTLYGHLQDVICELGDNVRVGAPVGIGGITGNSTGPHLHFEVRLKGQPIYFEP